MIRLTGLRKEYDGKAVLDVPALAILPGERYALIGPNGSGKTTLLRLLAGVLKPDAGTVAIEGLHQGEIGYLPQVPYAFDLTVLQNVMLAAQGNSAKEKRDRAVLALSRLGMTHLIKARGSRLSGGEKQRMALARLLAGSYKLLLLDEPTSAADIQAGDLIEAALLDYCAEEGCTLVFSSHAPSQALRLATRAVVLQEGRICEVGEVQSVLKAPRQESTKRFLLHWKL